MNNLNRTHTKERITISLAVCMIFLCVGTVPGHSAMQAQIRRSAPPWLSLFGTAVRPDGSIYVVGSKALLLTSTDHGKTWIQQIVKERPGSALFQDRDLYSIRFSPDGNAAWIVGEEGTILHSNDGGRTWTRQQSGTAKNLFKVAVLDGQTAAAVGADGTLLHTSDAGAHWQSAKSPKTITLFDVAFTGKSTVWAAGEFSTILTSKDGGQNWTLASGGNTSDFTIGPFFTIIFSDDQHGMVAGLAGELSATNDGGKTWKPAKLPDQVGTYVLAADPASKKLWVGANGGKMFVQNPGGPWREAPRTTFHDLTDMAFAANQGVAVGLNGTILLTKNAGDQWQVVQ